ncbi:hypothetical protein ACFFGR_13400 [Arthrobacter liuii]|nr:hypothetical protein [Arthrobacter liuii]
MAGSAGQKDHLGNDPAMSTITCGVPAEGSLTDINPTRLTEDVVE